MTRRTALKAALVQSAAIATARFPILGANDRPNIGIIGIGGRGRDHINYYSQTESRIAGLCDVNQAARERGSALVTGKGAAKPLEFDDMRRMFDSKDIDAVSITTPNHWHALAAIWACQAGKDVYVEKPASHNVFEGQQLINAARKYKRMVQVGSQSRSTPHKMEAIKKLQEGVIGELYASRGLCYRRRFSIGHTPDEAPPPGLDWAQFLGPAQWKPYSKNKFAYNWHWFWDTGNGDIGNQGVHQMDICIWALGYTGWPKSIASQGGKFVWQDDQETPNTLQTTFLFDKATMSFDTRNLPTPAEATPNAHRPNSTGNIFFGSGGYMILDDAGYEIYKSTAQVVDTTSAGAGAGSREKYEKVAEGKADRTTDPTVLHMRNFLEAIKSRDYTKLNAEVEIGVRAAAYCHLGNIAYRVNRTLVMTETGEFVNDQEASSQLTRNYRAPYIVPVIGA